MATIKVEVTYDPKKETLSQALASLLTEKPEHTEITAQMSLFDNPAPTETPTAQTSTEAPQESPAESASEAPDTKPTEEKTISKADLRALAVKLSKNDKAALKAIFKELGVANLSAVKEEDYPVFYEKLVAANGLTCSLIRQRRASVAPVYAERPARAEVPRVNQRLRRRGHGCARSRRAHNALLPR